MRHEQKVRLGVFAVVAAGLLVLLLVLFLAPRLFQSSDKYYVVFQNMSVNGLLTGAPVKFQGVTIGSVSRIRVNRRDLAQVVVEIRIEEGFPVQTDTRAALNYMGITGTRFVELSGGQPGNPRLRPGSTIAVSRGLGEKAEDIVANIDSVVSRLNRLLDPANLDRISLFLSNIERSSSSVAEILEKRKEALDRSLVNVDTASREFAKAGADIGPAIAELRGLIGTLQRDGGSVLSNLNARMSKEELGAVMADLKTFVAEAGQSLKTIEGAVVLQQDALNKTFISLAAALDNLSRLTRELTEDPAVLIRGRKGRK